MCLKDPDNTFNHTNLKEFKMSTKATPAPKLPVFGGTGNRELMGFASSVRGASKLIRSLIHIQEGFSLTVWKRTESICEILEVPAGFVFSVSYKY